MPEMMEPIANKPLLSPTLHIEALIRTDQTFGRTATERRGCGQQVSDWLRTAYDAVEVGDVLDLMHTGFDITGSPVDEVIVSGFTGPLSHGDEGFYKVAECALDVKAYRLLPAEEKHNRQGRSIRQSDETPSMRTLNLPNVALHDDWDSLVFDNGLADSLLRYLTRMVSITQSSDLNFRKMNLNRTCLLHGPPGSGKSTLCRALAQKLSIRLGGQFTTTLLMQIDTNALLSKYFSESGKIISATFDRILETAKANDNLVCVVLDEVETVAGSRGKVTSGGDCSDSLRATNQLLTALDRLRDAKNVFVLCTSNLIEAIDPAFVDRMDVKQLIPCPSPSAIYEIFRSCLNELIRSGTIETDATPTSPHPPSSPFADGRPDGHRASSPWTVLDHVPEWAEMRERLPLQPDSPGSKTWALAQWCVGLSGRSLRRLPVLGLAKYTWGGACSLSEAVAALTAAVEQELLVVVRT